MSKSETIKPQAEEQYAAELEALAGVDEEARPPGWRLSPRAVLTFIRGSDGKSVGGKGGPVIRRKYYGDDLLIERSIISLLGNRGLMLVGEPGTAKSMLSELLAAAISGDSGLTVQGTAGTTEDQIKYSWNYALLLAEGPTMRSLVPAPVYHGLQEGKIVRFEEITRCQPEMQDALVSILSDKCLHIPELGDDGLVQARKGFNIIATANLRDRGVNEMSSALKRRFNFETVPPIEDGEMEMQLVKEQTEELLRTHEVAVSMPEDTLDLLVTTFRDLRSGRTAEGASIEKPSTVMSTAEAVAVAFSSCLDAHYFGKGKAGGEHVTRQIVGTVFKDDPEDSRKLAHYMEVVAKVRSKRGGAWKAFYKSRNLLG